MAINLCGRPVQIAASSPVCLTNSNFSRDFCRLITEVHSVSTEIGIVTGRIRIQRDRLLIQRQY